MLARGIGGPHDLREAHRLLQRACMEDHPQALVRYGNLHETGDAAWGVSHNPGAAFRFYQRAAVRHDAPAAAYYALAMCYERGIGTTPSPPQALLFLRQAAAGGHKGALYLLRQRGDYSFSGATLQPGDSPAANMPESSLLGALPLRTIHVSPLPSHCTARDVGLLFARHGGLVGVKLLRVPSTPLRYALVEFVDDKVAERALRQHEAFSSRADETADTSAPPNPAQAQASSTETSTSSSFYWLPSWQLSWAKQNVRPPVYHWQPGMPAEEQVAADSSQRPQHETSKPMGGDIGAAKQAPVSDRTLK
jgi:hypothetical protein